MGGLRGTRYGASVGSRLQPADWANAGRVRLREAVPTVLLCALALGFVQCRERPEGGAIPAEASRRSTISASGAAPTGPASSVVLVPTHAATLKEFDQKGGGKFVLRLNRYSAGASEVLKSAQLQADQRHHKQTTPLHLLFACLGQDAIRREFIAVKADPDRSRALALKSLARLPKGAEPSYLSDDAFAVVHRAEAKAGSQKVSVSDLLHALIAKPQTEIKPIVAAGHLERILAGPSPRD